MSDTIDNAGTPDFDPEQFSRWVKEQFDNMARHAVENDLFSTGRIEGRPVWAIPQKAFMGRIWQTDDPANAYWVISGVFHTDHIPHSAASTAREAARHFSLKWQMQSARLDADNAAAPADAEWTGIGENLVRQAEALYSLVEQDKVWENVRDEV